MSTIKNIIIKTIPFLFTTIIGDSMSPSFTNGEIWITVPVWNKLRIGDVVVAKIDNKFVVKRIADIELQTAKPKVFLVGDNKEYSIDSRTYGAIGYNCIIRKVWKPSFFTRIVRRFQNEKTK